MEELREQKSYQDFKNELDKEFNTAAESFNRIGYLLKVARDTDILAESGYQTVAEFAEAEYGLRKDDVSRFIAINDRYSENGYSERLADKYRGYGRAKLQEMLSLPQTIVDEIPLTTTRAEIQEIKKEYKEEQQITDIEVMLEDKDEQQEKLDNNLTKVLFGLFEQKKEVLENIFKHYQTIGIETIFEALAPSGVDTHIIRVAGLGRFMLTITGIEDEISLIEMRSGTKEEYTWDDAMAAVRQVVDGNGDTIEELFNNLYGIEESVEEPPQEIKEPIQEVEIPTQEVEIPTQEVEIPTQEHENLTQEHEELEQDPVEDPVKEVEEPENEIVENEEVEPVQPETVQAEVIETPRDYSNTLKALAKRFYNYFESRIDEAYNPLEAIEDIRVDSYEFMLREQVDGVEISIEKEKSAYYLNEGGERIEEIASTRLSEYVERIIEEKSNKKNEESGQNVIRLDYCVEDIKKSIKSQNYIGAIQYAEQLISLLKDVIGG